MQEQQELDVQETSEETSIQDILDIYRDVEVELDSLDEETLEELLSEIDLTEEEQAELDEELSPAERAKRARKMKMHKAKLAIGQRIAKRRLASRSTIQKRSQRRARANVLKKLLKNRSKGDLSYSARAGYEKMLTKRKPMITKLAKRLKKDVRRDDISKFK